MTSIRRRDRAERLAYLQQVEAQANAPGPVPAGSDADRWRRMSHNAHGLVRDLIEQPVPDENVTVRELVNAHVIHAYPAGEYYNSPELHLQIKTIEAVLHHTDKAMAAEDIDSATRYRIITEVLQAAIVGARELRAYEQLVTELAGEFRETLDLIDAHVDGISDEDTERRLAALLDCGMAAPTPSTANE